VEPRYTYRLVVVGLTSKLTPPTYRPENGSEVFFTSLLNQQDAHGPYRGREHVSEFDTRAAMLSAIQHAENFYPGGLGRDIRVATLIDGTLDLLQTVHQFRNRGAK
jgi:hypothetical protein